MQLNISLDHTDGARAIFSMEIVGDPNNPAAGTYTVDLNESITLTIPEQEASEA